MNIVHLLVVISLIIFVSYTLFDLSGIAEGTKSGVKTDLKPEGCFWTELKDGSFSSPCEELDNCYVKCKTAMNCFDQIHFTARYQNPENFRCYDNVCQALVCIV